MNKNKLEERVSVAEKRRDNAIEEMRLANMEYNNAVVDLELHSKPKSHQVVRGECERCGKNMIMYKHGGMSLCRPCVHRVDEEKGRADVVKKAAAKKLELQACRSLRRWWGGRRGEKYCYKFDESCRESNRDKYDRVCFICGKDENNNGRRLSVHHVDMNKGQGCNDHEWKLVPLCKSCHARAHSKLCQARLEYLLTKDYL